MESQAIACRHCGSDQDAGTGDAMRPGDTLCATCDSAEETRQAQESRAAERNAPDMLAILRDALPVLEDHAGEDGECSESVLVERIRAVLEAIEGVRK